MHGAILSVTELSKTYGHVHAVRGMSFEVRAGEVYGLLGPNGAGKTTTLHCVVGLLTPTDGTITVGGHPQTAMEAKRALGFVPDGLALPGTLTGREYLAFVQSVYGVETRDAAETLTSVLGLDDAVDRLIREYSHGMHKKLQLLGALLPGPSLLILDEPFSGLDPEAVRLVRQIIVTRREQGTATLIATHDLPLAALLCDRFGIVAGGGLVAEGTLPELEAEHGSADLEEVYFRASGLEARAEALKERLSEALTIGEGGTTRRW